MNKKKFLSTLKKNLKGLSNDEIEDVLEYYNEYLNDLNIKNEDDIVDISILSPIEIAEEVSNRGFKTLERRVEDVEYTKERIHELEREVIFPNVTILQEMLKMEDSMEDRKKAYERMKDNVKRSLMEDEEIILETIISPCPGEVVRLTLTVYYEGIFLTNQRIFIFPMDYKYREIDKRRIFNIDDVEYIAKEEYLPGAVINFKGDETLTLRTYREADKELVLIFLKYLTENGIRFGKEKKFKMDIRVKVFSVVLCIVMGIGFLIKFIS